MDDVRQTLEQLGRYQDLESTLATVAAALERIPPRLAAIEATIAGAEKELAAARAALQVAFKERRSLEKDIEVVRAKISKYEDQMTAVKTNEQYRALSKEIATEREVISGIEEKILWNLERGDDLDRGIKDKEANLAREKERIGVEKQDLDQDRRRLERDRDAAFGEYAEVGRTLPGAALNLYRRLADVRGGIGIARVVLDACGGCRVRCRPHSLQQARTFEKMVQCESCQRILLPDTRVAET